MKNIDKDKEIVFKLLKENSHFYNSFDIGCIDGFGISAGILDTHNYGTIINRLNKALQALYFENKIYRKKSGRGYSYSDIDIF